MLLLEDADVFSQGRSHRKSAGLELDTGKIDTRLPNLSLVQNMQTINYWLLWCSLVVGMGAGVTYLSNLSEPSAASCQCRLPPSVSQPSIQDSSRMLAEQLGH